MAVFFFILLFRFAVPPPLFFFKRKKRGTARGQREAIDLSVARLWLLIVSVGGRCGTDFLLFLLFYSKTEKNNLKNQIKKLLSSTFFLSTRRHLVPLGRVLLLPLGGLLGALLGLAEGPLRGALPVAAPAPAAGGRGRRRRELFRHEPSRLGGVEDGGRRLFARGGGRGRFGGRSLFLLRRRRRGGARGCCCCCGGGGSPLLLPPPPGRGLGFSTGRRRRLCRCWCCCCPSGLSSSLLALDPELRKHRVQLLELLLLALLLRELSLQLFFCRGRGGRGVPASGRRRRRRRRRLWRELSLLVVVLAAASSSFFLLLLLLLVFREARDLDAELGLDRGLAGGELELDLVFGKRGSKEKRERDKVSVF